MTNTAPTGPIRATLIDITNCIGCRACQVACKQWNDREGEETELEAELGFQNPATLSAKTYTLIAFHEMENPNKPGGVESAFRLESRYLPERPISECADPAGGTAFIRDGRRSTRVHPSGGERTKGRMGLRSFCRNKIGAHIDSRCGAGSRGCHPHAPPHPRGGQNPAFGPGY